MFLIIFSLSWVLGIILGLSFNVPFPMLFSGLIPVLLIPLFKKIIMRLLLVSFCLLIFWGAALYAHTTIPSKTILDSINKTGEIQSTDVLKLITVAGLLTKYADRLFNAEVSISQTQFAVLLAVDSTKPPVIQSDVSAKLQRGLNTVSMLIDRMVQQGLLERTRSKPSSSACMASAMSRSLLSPSGVSGRSASFA